MNVVASQNSSTCTSEPPGAVAGMSPSQTFNPPPPHTHTLLPLSCVLSQWVVAVLNRLEAEWSKDRRLLSIKVSPIITCMQQESRPHTWSHVSQHSLVASLVEGLGSRTPCHVTSVCTVLLAACVQHRWLAHQELLSAMVTQAITAPIYSPIIEGMSRLLLQEMASIEEACSLYISPYSLR